MRISDWSSDVCSSDLPASLAPPFDDSGLDQYADMARHARLTLVEHDRQFADRQFHLAQERDDSQPGRIGKSAKNIEQLSHDMGYKAFFISGQRGATPLFPAEIGRAHV